MLYKISQKRFERILIMSKTVFLFSGQGSQYVGMAKELCEQSLSAKNIFDTAEKVLGFDLAEICFNSSEETLSKTIYAQPAIMATSLCAFEVAKEKGIIATAVAGHSLGEYAAMVASGMLSVEDGFKVIKARSEAMQKASENSSGAMCAIIGLSAEEVEEVCESIDGYVIPVNYNSSAQTVIAGDVDAIEKAIVAFTEMKAKAIKLNVSSAFHSKLMKGAADEFYLTIKDVKFSSPKLDFYSNVTGNMLTDFSDMPSLLAKHIVSPVKFTSELNTLFENGYENFVELGPNKVLTGLVKKTLKGVTALNIENSATLEKAITTLSAE